MLAALTLEPQMQQQISGLIDLGTLSVEALVDKLGNRPWYISGNRPRMVARRCVVNRSQFMRISYALAGGARPFGCACARLLHCCWQITRLAKKCARPALLSCRRNASL